MLSFRRLAALCLLLLAVLAFPQQLCAATLDPDDAMLLDIRLDELRMGNGARGYQTADGICVDFGDIASALDVAVEIAKDRRSATGWVFDEHAPLDVNRDQAIIRSHGRTAALKPGDISDTQDGWCVLTGTLAQWLGVSIEVDTLNALLLVHSDVPLPAQQLLTRAAKAALLDARKGVPGEEKTPPIRKVDIPYWLWRNPSIDVSARFGTSEGKINRGFEIFGAGEAFWMSTETRIASDDRGKINALRARLYRNDPDGGLLGSLRATEFALGDVTSAASHLTAQSAAGRGISMTNRPLGQASQFDTTSFQGDLPIGWDVELFRNGELIGLTQVSTNGRYQFLDVPLVYGSNLFEIVRHGPQGQIRRERHVYEVGASAVPPGTLWWWADVVEKNRDLIGLGAVAGRDPTVAWRQGAGAEYGLDKRTSLALSFYSLEKSSVRHSVAEGEIRRAIGMMTATVTGASDMRRARALMLSGIGRAAGFRFSLRSIVNRGLDTDLLDRTTRTSHIVNLDRDMTLGGLLLPIHFDLGGENRTDGSRSRNLGMRTSISVAGISSSITGRVGRTALPARPYGPVEGGVGLLVSGRMGKVGLRGELTYRLGAKCMFSDARVTAQWSLSPRDSWQAGFGYSWDAGHGSYSFSYSHDFGKVALSATTNGDTGGKLSAMLGIRFSVGPDASGRLRRISSDHLASSGRVDVTVYRDGNGDGVRQPDEAVEAEAGLLVGGQPVKADSRRANPPSALDGLSPTAAVAIGIDPATLSDPLLDPAVRAVRVVPRKGLTVHLTLGVESSGVIDGMARHRDGRAAPGIAIA